MKSFKDSYPNEIEFEIDRNSLLRYMLSKARLTCFGLPLPFIFALTIASFSGSLRTYRTVGFWFAFNQFALYMTVAMVIAAAFGTLLYYAYFKNAAIAYSRNLRLIVEGPYLRYVNGNFVVTDRRYHFRDIHSYAIVEGPLLRRFGLKALSFHTKNQAQFPISIVGLLEPLQVRDQLCDIDAAREAIRSD